MAKLKSEIDEERYLSGLLLGEALFVFSNSETVRNYHALINSRSDPVKVQNTGTLLGALQSINDSMQASQETIRKRHEAFESLYREILNLVKKGELRPIGYQLPRKLSDVPIEIPIDIFLGGEIDWKKSELSYREFQFTGVRLLRETLKEEKSSDEIIPVKDLDTQNQNSLKDGSLKGQPEIQKSFSELDPELYIDEKRAAEYLGLSPRTLQGYRVKGGGPEFLKISHKVVRYKIADLLEWIKNRKRKNTSDF